MMLHGVIHAAPIRNSVSDALAMCAIVPHQRTPQQMQPRKRLYGKTHRWALITKEAITCLRVRANEGNHMKPAEIFRHAEARACQAETNSGMNLRRTAAVKERYETCAVIGLVLQKHRHGNMRIAARNWSQINPWFPPLKAGSRLRAGRRTTQDEDYGHETKTTPEPCCTQELVAATNKTTH